MSSHLQHAKAFHGFSVDDVGKAHRFYADVLGLECEEQNGMLWLHVGGGRTPVYPKGTAHQPAAFTVLNLPAVDVEAAVDDLTARGVVFERYEGSPNETDAKGVFRGGGPLIAWFTDPAGNVLSVIEDGEG